MVIPFTLTRRRGWFRAAQLLLTTACTVSLVACSGQGSATGVPADSPVRIETTSTFVTVQNQAGLPLTDVTISIVPYGVQQAYTKFFVRLESSEKREIGLGEFSGRDGTRFSLRVARPKTVRVKASDISGKKYEVEYPWN